MAGHGQPREVSRRELGRGTFISLQEILWRDGQGVERRWESAERAGQRAAVLVIARLVPSQRVVLIRQFRPPARGLVWEFPAGIVDDGETPEQAALREMREETGYHGMIRRVFPAAYNSPGLSSERVHVVCMEIDEQAAANRQPVAEPDEGESIEVRLVGRDDFAAFAEREGASPQGGAFDSKVVGYLCGVMGW